MGYDRTQLTIQGHVSRHNSPRDQEDDADWEEFVNRVDQIRREHRYERLNLEFVP